MAENDVPEEESRKFGADEEDTGAQIAPIVKLDEVAVTTGEESEDVLLDMSMLVMKKSCVWHATNFSDGELKEELFCIRFGTLENAKKFMAMVEEIAESQAKKSEEEDEASTALKELKVEGQKEDSKEVKEKMKENVKANLEGEKPETKGQEKEEKSEAKGEEKEVEKPETKGEEKELEKLETKAEETVEEPVEPKQEP